MVLYVPGTEERDSKKVIMSLQQIAAAVSENTDSIEESEAAWTAYIPTIAPGSGTFTAVGASGRYKQVGKTVFVQIQITITTNGTAASYISATLPVADNSTLVQFLPGREGTIGNVVSGGIAASMVFIKKYDSTYPGASGAIISMGGVYEAA